MDSAVRSGTTEPKPAGRSHEAQGRLLLGAYNVLLVPLRAAFAVYAPLARLRGASREELRGRLGHLPPLTGHPLWIQAASVGEAGIAALLAGALARERPGTHLLVTTTTRTGQAAARRALPEPAAIGFFPLDFRPAVRRALDAVRPSAIVLVETELWPNLLLEASAREIPVLVVNGRLSDRAYRRSRMAASLFARALSGVSCACVQTALDADRFVALGAPREKVHVTGNIKFAAGASARDAGSARSALGVGPEVELWVAGSTAEGEEEAALAAFRALPPDGIRRILVLAPRRPERWDAVAARLASCGMPWRRRSAAGAQAPTAAEDRHADGSAPEVVLLDTLGELASVYAAATAAFVGGTLVPLGGHNIIEPAASGVAPIFGPHVENVREVAARLVEAGAAFPVRDGEDLTRTFARLAADPGLRRRAGDKAREVVASQSGALEATLARIRPFLDARERARA